MELYDEELNCEPYKKIGIKTLKPFKINKNIKKALKKIRAFINVPGDYLLSHASFPRSTIGAIGLNFRVRDGIGGNSYAMITGEIFGN